MWTSMHRSSILKGNARLKFSFLHINIIKTPLQKDKSDRREKMMIFIYVIDVVHIQVPKSESGTNLHKMSNITPYQQYLWIWMKISKPFNMFQCKMKLLYKMVGVYVKIRIYQCSHKYFYIVDPSRRGKASLSLTKSVSCNSRLRSQFQILN